MFGASQDSSVKKSTTIYLGERRHERHRLVNQNRRYVWTDICPELSTCDARTVASFIRPDSDFTSFATIAKLVPRSPARAASIEAFTASIDVCRVTVPISSTILDSSPSVSSWAVRLVSAYRRKLRARSDSVCSATRMAVTSVAHLTILTV